MSKTFHSIRIRFNKTLNKYMHYVFMPKVITISDEVYEKLSKLKKGRSFSKTIDELIEFYEANKKGNKEILREMFGTISEGEANELEKEIIKFRKSFTSRENYGNT
jgi:predicted CopG family antitoxin